MSVLDLFGKRSRESAAGESGKEKRKRAFQQIYQVRVNLWAKEA